MTIDVPAQRTIDAPKPRPRGLSTRQLRFDFFTPRRPVQWLAPVQLARTGLRVGLAAGIGGYLDKRELQNSFLQDELREDEERDDQGRPIAAREELWLDYVADTGDGFNATYAVAYSLGQESVKVGKLELPRGQVLVMGGDEVYPTPSPADYDDRLRGPFHAALPDVAAGRKPTIYALPGNHDWYDGLTAFFRVFTGAKTTIGAWTTRQKRSYFAMRLPNGWWLFALDAQQGAHIDDPQLEYFHRIIHERMAAGDRIILCTPDPAWVQGDADGDAYRAIDYFLRKVVDVEGQEAWLAETFPTVPQRAKAVAVPVTISGDWHHYSRYELAGQGEDRRHLITCGGGGAYLLGTQQLPGDITVPPRNMRPPKCQDDRTYGRAKRFPSWGRSVWLGLGAPVRLPWRNPTFVAMLGLLQLLMLYARSQSEDQLTMGVITMSAIVFGLAYFLASGLGSEAKKWPVVLALALPHSVAQWYGVRWVMDRAMERAQHYCLQWTTDPAEICTKGEVHNLSFYVLYGLVAGLVSAVLVGIYLILASLVRVNLNELFSSQRIEGYKSFLRLHIGPSGELTIYAVGIRRVRRLLPGFRRLHWKPNPRGAAHEPWFKPRRRLRYRLIEEVTIPPSPGRHAA